MTTPTITCGWTDVAPDVAARFPDAVAAHAAHPTLGECDSWHCSCGNEPHRDGFYPVAATGDPDAPWAEVEPDERWNGLVQCFGCGAIYRSETGALVTVADRVEPMD